MAERAGMNIAKNRKYFYNLEKTNHRKKHITSLKVNDHAKLTDPTEILEEEERFFKHIYTSKNTDPNSSEFIDFFNTENVLSVETAKICEGIMPISECKRARYRWPHFRILSLFLERCR